MQIGEVLFATGRHGDCATKRNATTQLTADDAAARNRKLT